MESSQTTDPLVDLAKTAAEEYIKHGNVISSDSKQIPSELNNPAGVFVCLKIDGQLRGCIGTIEPVTPALSEEIIQNAISASTRDPRFRPVTPNELDKIKYSVDVLGEPEQIYDLKDLDPKVYGVIVETRSKRGLLLPDLEGVDTIEDQVSIAMRKAGITSNEEISLFRFKVIRHE